MMKSEKKRTGSVWLRLPGYQVVALKPEFGEHVNQLERAIQEGVPADLDPSRTDFYDVALDEGTAYVCVFRGSHKVYLIAHSPSALNWLPQGSLDGKRIPAIAS
jgi:hypothetical protein